MDEYESEGELGEAAGVVLGVMLVVADQRRHWHAEHHQLNKYASILFVLNQGFPSFLVT
jgi:hypothetical protein